MVECWDDIEHPNQELHPEQRLYVALIDDYVTWFLFTATELLHL